MAGSVDAMMGGRLTAPKPGAGVTSPFTVTGFANAFEGAVQIVLRDKNGAEVTRKPATGAMGMFGAFSISLSAPLNAGLAPYALEMAVASPRDGAISVIAQESVNVEGISIFGRQRLEAGALPATLKLSTARVRNVTAMGFEVEFVSSAMCQGSVWYPRELAGASLGTQRALDEQPLATYHVVTVSTSPIAGLAHGKIYRWSIACEYPATQPPSPDTRVSLSFELSVP
jgi:hypothetical protein